MTVLVFALDHPEIAPHPMPDRFRHEVAYFMYVRSEAAHPPCQPGEYWVDLKQAQEWYDDGAIQLVSPLDSENRTEVELSEEQEGWLEWLLAHGVAHIRLE